MPVHTLEDITSFNTYQRKKLVNRVLEAAPEERVCRPSSGGWTVLEHLEHVAVAALHFTDELERLVAAAKEQGLTAWPDTPRVVDGMLAFAAAGKLGQKRKAPPELEPTGRSLTESLALLDQVTERALTAAGELPYLDTDKIIHYQPITEAEFNLAQFWHLQGLHDVLHTAHIDGLLTAYRAQTAGDSPGERMQLKGERILLRLPCPADVECRFRWYADPAVTRYLPLAGKGSIPKAEIEAYINRVNAPDSPILDFSIDLLDGPPIGACSLRDLGQAKSAELSLIIGEPSAWGRGYGAEALRLLIGHGFSHLGLETIWLTVRSDNLRATHLYRSLGFVQESTERVRTRDGVEVTKHCMSLQASDYKP